MDFLIYTDFLLTLLKNRLPGYTPTQTVFLMQCKKCQQRFAILQETVGCTKNLFFCCSYGLLQLKCIEIGTNGRNALHAMISHTAGVTGRYYHDRINHYLAKAKGATIIAG